MGQSTVWETGYPEQRIRLHVLVGELSDDPRGEEVGAELRREDPEVLRGEDAAEVVLLGERGYQPIDQHLT